MKEINNNTTLEQMVKRLSFEDKCELICHMFTYNYEFSKMIRKLTKRQCRRPLLCALTTKDLKAVLEKRGYKLIKIE